MNKQDMDNFVNEVYEMALRLADKKDLTNEEFLIFLSKLNQKTSEDLTYFLSKALPR